MSLRRGRSRSHDRKRIGKCPFQKQLESIRYDKTINGVAPNAPAPLQNGVRYFQGSNVDLAVMIHDGGHVYPQGTSQKIVTFFQNQKMP